MFLLCEKYLNAHLAVNYEIYPIFRSNFYTEKHFLEADRHEISNLTGRIEFVEPISACRRHNAMVKFLILEIYRYRVIFSELFLLYRINNKREHLINAFGL